MTLETRKDGTKFTSRALKEAAERQAELASRYEALQKDLVAQVGQCLRRAVLAHHCASVFAVRLSWLADTRRCRGTLWLRWAWLVPTGCFIALLELLAVLGVNLVACGRDESLQRDVLAQVQLGAWLV
jgi:hypothetical protein